MLALVKVGNVELISSTVLELETGRNPLALRREHGEQVLAQATAIVIVILKSVSKPEFFLVELTRDRRSKLLIL